MSSRDSGHDRYKPTFTASATPSRGTYGSSSGGTLATQSESDEPVTFDVPGVIRNAREAEDTSSQYRACGLEFAELGRSQRNALQLFIYERMLSEI